MVTSLASFWAFWKVLEGKTWFLPVTIFLWGLSVQFQFFMIYQLVIFAVMWIFLAKNKIPSKKLAFISLITAIVSFMWLLVSEIKFSFQGTKAFLSFLPSQFTGSSSNTNMMVKTVQGIVELFGRNIAGNFYPVALATTIIVISTFIYITITEKNKQPHLFLLIWLLSPLILSPFSRRSGIDLYVGIGSAVVLVTGYVLSHLSRRFIVLFIVLITYIATVNIYAIQAYNKVGDEVFAPQKGMLLSDEKKVIDYTYTQSNNQPFSINTVTNPLFINTTWSYLYFWYGKSTYGYLPTWWGDPQGSLEEGEVPFESDIQSPIHFLILENSLESTRYFAKLVRHLEDERSSLVESKTFGSFTVEKRTITNSQSLFSSDVFEYKKEIE
jgi:hypothetical protein